MNLTLTCKCGKKFTVDLQYAGMEIVCASCGRRAKVPTPKIPSPSVPSMEIDQPRPQQPIEVEEEEVRLQELKPPPRPTPAAATQQEIEEGITLQPIDLPTRIQSHDPAKPRPQPVVEEDDSAGYDVDANDAMSGLEIGAGVYGTFAVIGMDEYVPCIAYGSRGDWALAGQGNDVLVVNMKTKMADRFFEDHDAEVTSVALSPSEPLALSADDDGIMHLWDAATCKRKQTFRAHDGATLAVALSLDGKFAASGGQDSCICLWDLASGKRRDLEYADWDEWEEVATYVAFARDSKQLLAGGSGGRVCIWSVETGERIKRYAGLDLPISCLRLSDEGGKLTAATHPVRSGNTNYLVVCHWDTKTGKPKDHFNIAVDSTPCCMIPDRNGSRIIIAGGGTDPWMGVWSLERGKCRHIYDDLRGAPISLAVSPLNNRVLAALHNEQLQLFGLEPF